MISNLLFFNWTRFVICSYVGIIGLLLVLNYLFCSKNEYWVLLTISIILFISYTVLLLAFFKFKKWFLGFLEEAGISFTNQKRTIHRKVRRVQNKK